jgi:hypothetical protein
MMVSGSITFEQSLLPSLMGFGLIGIWLVIVNVGLRRYSSWSVRRSSFGIAVGVGLLLLALGLTFGDQQLDPSRLAFSDPFVIVGLAGAPIGLLGYSVWAILLWMWLAKPDAA